LEHNRKVVETLKLWQEWFLEGYCMAETDEDKQKYVRKMKKVSRWIKKIPVRAYQIK